MNSVILMGRLVKDPISRVVGDTTLANYRLAVDRRYKRDGQPDADFFDCVAFGRQAEFAEKYLHQGTKMVIQGRLQNDNYTDKDGRTVYRNQIVIENQEFAESKAANTNYAGNIATAQAASVPAQSNTTFQAPTTEDGFMEIPDGIDEELPFN